MNLSEKLTQGAGIAFAYAGGVAAIWLGGLCTLISLIVWGVGGFSIPLALIFAIFGLAPLGTGIWLFRRGKVLRDLLKVKLQKETVRKLAFQKQGRLTPKDLARAQNWGEEKALNALKNLAAEDPERMTLQLNYESGEIYFDFSDILESLEARKQYQALPLSNALGDKAVDIAMILGKTIDTFQDYVEMTRETVSQQRHEKREERYRAKIERFLDEIETLKNQAAD